MNQASPITAYTTNFHKDTKRVVSFNIMVLYYRFIVSEESPLKTVFKSVYATEAMT